jgi:hypothetical protein
MPRHRQNDIGRLATANRVLSTADKEDLLHGLTSGPWRGPEEVIVKLEQDLGLRPKPLARRCRKVERTGA